MKAVMISIRPEWVAKILSGEKTVEVRKTVPKMNPPFKCYIYETQGKTDTPWMDEEGHTIFRGRGQVVAEFICDRITTIAYTMDGLACVVDCKTSCLSPKDFIEYGKGKPLKGWHISELKIYDKPKELSDFRIEDKSPCENRERVYQNPEYNPTGGLIYGGSYCRDTSDWCKRCKTKVLSKPPQSWCYVEEQ